MTLTLGDALRGCIGNLVPDGPLYAGVLANARNAALHDARFAPVGPDEVVSIRIEISVLTEPRPLPFASPEELLALLTPHQDGVLLEVGGRRATFLPQVWEQLPQAEDFLSHLARKAGARPDAWRAPDARVSIYTVEAFAEPD